MNREPVNIEFVLRSDIEKEIAKVQLCVESLGTKGEVSYKKLVNSSNEAFNALSKDAQSQAVSLQKTILSIRQNEEAFDALKKKFEEGKISTSDFAEASARLSVQQAELKATATGLSAQLQREVQISKEVEGSYNQKILRLKQLKEQYAQLSEEERNNVTIGGEMINQIKKLDEETTKFEETLRAVKTAASDSIDGMRSKLSELEKQYNSLSQKERNSNIGKSLSAQMRTLSRDIESAGNANRSFLEQMKAAPGPIGATVTSIHAMTKAAMRFIATPLGAIIAAIVVAVKALTTWFKRTEAGEMSLAKISAYFGQVLNSLLNIVSKVGEGLYKVGEWLYKVFTKPKEALNELVDFFKGQLVNRLNAFSKWGEGFMKLFSKDTFLEGLKQMANATLQFSSGVEDSLDRIKKGLEEINKNSDRQARIAAELKAIERERKDISVQVSEAEAKIAGLRLKAKDNQQDEKERLKAIKQAEKIVEESAQKEIDAMQRAYELTKESLFLKYNISDETKLETGAYSMLKDLQREINAKKAEQLNKQRQLLDQQNAINNAIENEKTGQELLEEELKKKKESYQLYYRFITATSKATAQGMFSDLVKEGDSYLEYINRKIAELTNNPARTEKENIQLTVYTSEKQELTGSGSAVDILKREIDEKKRLYNEDILAFRNYLKEKKKALTEDQSEEGYKQTVVIEVELQTADETYQKKLDDLLKKYGGFTTQMVSLTKDYQRNKAILEKAGTQESRDAIENLTNEYNNAVLQLKNGSENFLKAIFGDIDRLGYQALKNLKDQTEDVLDSARETTQGGQTFVIVDVEEINEQGQVIKRQVKLTVEEFARLQKRYNELYDAIEEKNPFSAISESFNDALDALQSGDKEKFSTALDAFNKAVEQGIDLVNQWGDSLGQIFGEETANNIKVLTDLVKGVKDLGVGIGQLASGDIIGGITNTLKGAAEIYTTLTAGAKKYREAQKEWTNELIRLQLDYNSVLNEQLRIQEQSNVFITDYVNRIKDAYIALSDAQSNFNDQLKITKYNYLEGPHGRIPIPYQEDVSLEEYLKNLEIKIGVKKKKFLGITTGSQNIYGSLLENYRELIDESGQFNAELAKTLISVDGITDETKNALEELISYQEQINASTDAINSAIESIAGSIGSDLYGALREAWDGGTDSFEAFKKSVSEGIKDIVSQLLFNEIFASQFDALQENLKKSFSLTGDQSVLDDFTAFLNSSPALLSVWEQAMKDFEEAARAAGFEIESLNDDLTGSTAEGIQDAISQGFENGYRSASDFADTFEDLMKKAVLESMKLQVLEQPLKEWYSSFSESMRNGTLAENMTSLNESFNSIIEQAAEYIKGLETSTGLDFGVSQTADKNSIKSITEETASKLEGHFVAVRINTGKLVESAESILALTAKNQLHLAAIERNTTELTRLENIESAIRRIESNGIKLKA